MKKTFTLFAALILLVVGCAAHSQSRISISSLNKGDIRVMIDGNRFNVVDDQFVLDNFRPGIHTIKIYLQRKGVKSQRFNNNFQLVYNSRVNVKPQYHIDIVINRFGKAFYDERPKGNGYYDNNWPDNDLYDTNNDNWGNNGWDNSNDHNYMRPMSAQSFDRFRESLKNENFEGTRLNIAKQVISGNWFTTAQVREVMNQFNFENNKLEVAKYAYKYTIDRSDYFTIADTFSFSNNKEELIRYMEANK